MLNKKEIISILLATLVLGFTISLVKSWEIFLYTSLTILAVILINVFAKKIAAYKLDSKIEIENWELRQTGLLHIFNPFPWIRSTHPTRKLDKAFPIGVLLPILTMVLSAGYMVWMGVLSFDIKPNSHRAARRYGIYTFSEITEYQIGLIAAAGIIANLFFAVVGYLIGSPEFSKLNIYFAAYNIIPLSTLDGNKMFFGSTLLWSFVATLTLIGLAYAIMLI